LDVQRQATLKIPGQKNEAWFLVYFPGFPLKSGMWKKRFLCGYFLFIPSTMEGNLVLSIITMYRVQKGQNTLTWAPNIEHYD
jgi:hypothetical protein